MKEGTGTEKVHSLKGAEYWFIENHEGGVVCVRNGIEKKVYSYQAAMKFYEETVKNKS